MGVFLEEIFRIRSRTLEMSRLGSSGWALFLSGAIAQLRIPFSIEILKNLPRFSVCLYGQVQWGQPV
ncbi:MAG: hypothetical protein WD941_04960, partial [Opitutus sp.]